MKLKKKKKNEKEKEVKFQARYLIACRSRSIYLDLETTAVMVIFFLRKEPKKAENQTIRL